MQNYNAGIQRARKIARSSVHPEQLVLLQDSGDEGTKLARRPIEDCSAGPVTTESNSADPVTNRALPTDDARLERLYAEPMPARRSGALYNAFSYPTKIDPEAIAIFVAAHTSPGDTVLDVFSGSGTTGLAVRLCENPTDAMRARARELDLPVEWGPRSAVLYELSVVGALLTQTMCEPPDPAEFADAATKLVAAVSAQLGWIYAAEGPDGAAGCIRHTIWSDVIVCGSCGARAPFWELAVARDPLVLKKDCPCPRCGADISLGDAPRATESVIDPATGEELEARVRRPAFLYGRSGRKTWQRALTADDLDVVARVLAAPLPDAVPSSPIAWGDLHRSGYHQGIERIHHLYTHRNLLALGTLWEAIERQPSHLRDALRLLVLSYNATHSTLMTRVVVKNGLTDFVLTGAQTGVLYVSSLPVEKNVFEGITRKIKTFRDAFALTRGSSGSVSVANASSTNLDLPDDSIDYVFTDPPFGGFIPYAEINQINEAWLGQVTDSAEEAIISPAQGKGASQYGDLMKRIFAEVSRVMKADAVATVVFHSSKPDVWSALGEAFSSADLAILRTSVLDKTQVSFKQVVSDGATRGDAVFLLSRGRAGADAAASSDLKSRIIELRDQHGGGISLQHLYSRYVAGCLEDGRQVDLTSGEFYAVVRSMDAHRL
jgi:DNA methylase